LTARQRRYFGARASGYPIRRANPYRRNPGKGGIGTGTILLIAGGAFLLLGGGRVLGNMTGGLLNLGQPAAVPPGYTPIGNGLYRTPTGAVVARDPNTGAMIQSPVGYAPTSAEDLLTRAGIALIPTAAQSLASWVSGLFRTQGTATTPISTSPPLPPGTTGISLPGGDSLPALPPIPDLHINWPGPVDTTGQLPPIVAGEPGFSLWGEGALPDIPPLADPWSISSFQDLNAAPGGGELYSLWGPETGGISWDQYQLPELPSDYQYGWNLDLGLSPVTPDVGLTVGGSDVTIYDPSADVWGGFWGYGRRGYGRSDLPEPKYLRRPASYR
jgi:hypothetical protein